MIGTQFTSPAGMVWEVTNILEDGQILLTSTDGRYVVVKDIENCASLICNGYGDPYLEPVYEAH